MRLRDTLAAGALADQTPTLAVLRLLVPAIPPRMSAPSTEQGIWAPSSIRKLGRCLQSGRHPAAAEPNEGKPHADAYSSEPTQVTAADPCPAQGCWSLGWLGAFTGSGYAA